MKLSQTEKEFLGKELTKFIEELISFAKNIDPSKIRTAKQQLFDRFETKFNNDTQDVLTNDIVRTMATVDVVVHSKQLRSEIARERKRRRRSPVATNLYKLLSLAEDKVAYSPLVVYFSGNPLEQALNIFEPYDLLDDIRWRRGEKAARKSIRLFQVVSEYVYSPYVKAVYALTQIALGKTTITYPHNQGPMVDQLLKDLDQLGLSSLVEDDFIFIRNAASHNDSVYDPITGKIEMKDKYGHIKSFTAKELHAKSLKMMSVVTEMYLPMILSNTAEKIAMEWIPFLEYFQANLKQIVVEDKILNAAFEKKISEITTAFEKIIIKPFETKLKI